MAESVTFDLDLGMTTLVVMWMTFDLMDRTDTQILKTLGLQKEVDPFVPSRPSTALIQRFCDPVYATDC